ncbi:iron-sulfur cluster-binding protein [Hahella sp. CCB-MM4]|uniref:LutB/LldF family L-lactate oxidation iron-sulfur protein n=1 Tax=Hahella sp. (strain CCB-MM4) TaxID=1926491 RepID=UPI000B9A7AA3|nr:LutB/LldF family L-lactate oxidation iron-sulfur protein [Hahella sp. CCB-MM4]OZG71720.1 iron-sulfur cluster-binding protein [Hahella sp. CCB-MM4]
MTTQDAGHINLNFKNRVNEALADQELRGNFRGAMDFLMQKRAAMFPDQEDLEALRKRGEQVRNRCLQQLPDLLEQLEAQCVSNGIQVHWAETAEQANNIILGIMRDHQATRMVKGKSMASEEIGLNHFLADHGIEALESDMGEYIVQLDHSTPSHIIMPAIHKNKQQIARLFHEKTPGVEYTEDVDKLIGTGREVLRQKFFEAEVGLSGVNFAVAETGTLCLVENEGNGRMSTTVPPVHIALCGIEKVVQSLADIPPLYRLLTRSATGQAITTYFNMISGPRKPDELDGPQEVHLVLLDNGRSRMYADKQLQQTLRCIRCGACMNHCPVYTRIGGHAYGSTYPGPIGQVVSPQIWGLNNAGNITQACSLNGACRDACPVNIPLPDLIRRLRHDGNNSTAEGQTAGQGQLRKPAEAVIWKFWALLNRSPLLYRLTLWSATRFRKLIPSHIGPWTRYRSAPRPASKSLHDLMKASGTQTNHPTNQP